MIRDAKFPKKLEVASYSQVRRPLQSALTTTDFGRADLASLAERLDAKARRETGWPKDEALRCKRAVEAFLETFGPRSLSKCSIHPAPPSISTAIEGVRVKVTLDAAISADEGDATYGGGMVLLYAFSADRSGVKERLATASGLILWALESGQMEPLPRLCMAVDLAAKSLTRASSSHSRLRAKIADSCGEVAARWDGIQPPPGYDGPDWRH